MYLVGTCQGNGSCPFNVPDMFPPIFRGPRPQCPLVPLCFVVLISTNLLNFCGPRLVRVLLLVVNLVALTYPLRLG